MALHPEMLQRFHELLNELSDIARGGEPQPKRYGYTGTPNENGVIIPPKRITTMVGLSMGPHEEIRDLGYKRQRIEFVECPDGQWRNVSGVHFPMAVSTYGADSIIVEGIDIQKKIVARMAQPVLCQGGINGLGFAPNALTVAADVMRDATATQQAPVSDEFDLNGYLTEPPSPPQRLVMPPVPEKYKEHIREHLAAFNALSGRSDVMSAATAATVAAAYRAQKAAQEREPEPTEEAPLYCDHCERISLARRNQLVSMGHQVSHLVELPNEAGYALPCKSCRKP